MATNFQVMCSRCGAEMEAIRFIEEETKVIDGRMYRTGRKRRAVSHFECPYCFQKEAVDDSFDGPWYGHEFI